MAPGHQHAASCRALAVMVVEDEFLLALELETILEQQGYRVIGPAASIGQALRLLDRERPDAAVLDANLGGEWVTPVAAVLCEAGIPYLIASAYGPAELERSGLPQGARNIGKPVEERRLLAALAEVVVPQ